jgi:hypothetical protein
VRVCVGIITAPLLFAAEEYPVLREMMLRKFERAGDLEEVLFPSFVPLCIVSLWSCEVRC